jgi:hypothetical protein
MMESKALMEATRLRGDEIHSARELWHKSHPMRLILNAESDRMIAEVRTKLESCKPDDLASLQGEIRAIRKMKGIINEQNP